MEFTEYVDARRTTLVRAACLLGHTRPDAEDLAQATLTKAFRSWRRLQRSDNIDGDVYQILIINAQQLPAPSVETERETLAAGEQTSGMQARLAIAEMPRADREILVLRCFLDLSEATTAELLGLPTGAVTVDSEAGARNLVQEAAETIDVAPVPFEPTPQAHRGPWLGLLAAGVALVLGVGLVTGWWSTDDKRADVIEDNDHQIPSVFGYDASSARDLLEAEGWVVTEVDALSCEPVERALGTVPQAGATPSSAQVKLLVSVPADNLGCGLGQGISSQERALAWQVLDFARVGAPLEFADELTLFVNSRRADMPADKAAMRNTSLMQDLVRVLSDDAGAVIVEGGTWSTPLLTTRMDPGDSRCGGLDLPKGFGNRESLLMYIALPAFNVAPTGKCHFLNVFTTEGTIDGFVLRTGVTDTPERPMVSVPDVVGVDLKVARKSLRAEGFTIETAESGCPGTKVLEQNPESGALAKPGATVRLQIGREDASDCHDFGTVDTVVRGFPDFAAGRTNAIGLGSSIDLLLGSKLFKTISTAEALDKSNWELCATYAQRSCPMSALTTLLDGGSSRIVGAPSGCFGELGTPPQRLRITRIALAERTATIESDGDGSCTEYWGVQIWVNEAGQLIAANLLLGDP